MTIALRDAPGVSSPYNWITDIGGPVDPNSLNSVQLPLSGYGVGAILFTLPNTAPAMTFNQMGIMGGPLKHANGTPNVGGVVTLNLLRGFAAPSGYQFSSLGQVSIDLTAWVPGQFYWSDPLPTTVNISQAQGYIFNLTATCPVPYSVYANRPCTLRNGNTWGSGLAPGFALPHFNNDHLCHGGSVDLSVVNYKDLGTASLAPSVAFSGRPQREGGMRSLLSPQIGIEGQLTRRGVFEGVNDLGSNVILSATSMAGGPLWKPAKLCTG